MYNAKPPEKDRATDMCNRHKNFSSDMQFRRYARGQTDRQTNWYINTLITTLRSAVRNGVKFLLCHLNIGERTDRQVCVSLLSLLLRLIAQRDATRICCCAPAPAARRPQLSVDIFCPRGAQQQTSRPPLLLSIDVTDRRTDGRPTVTQTLLRILAYAGSVNQSKMSYEITGQN